MKQTKIQHAKVAVCGTIPSLYNYIQKIYFFRNKAYYSLFRTIIYHKNACEITIFTYSTVKCNIHL